MAEDKKTGGIFQKVLDLTTATLESQIIKARGMAADLAKSSPEADFNFGKAVTRDMNFNTGSQGFQEKGAGLSYEYQKQMALRSSIIAAIIKTRQNKGASFSEYVPEGNKTGFRVVLKHEEEMLEEIMEEMFGTMGEVPLTETEEGSPDNNNGSLQAGSDGFAQDKIQKADGDADTESVNVNPDDQETPGENDGSALDPSMLAPLAQANQAEIPEEPLSEEDMRRQAKEELEKRTKDKKAYLAEFLLNCGETKDRPFETKKWNFDSFLRAMIWDSLVYDQMAIERIPKEAAKLKGKFNMHHFQPVDGSTVRYSSQELRKYKSSDMHMAQDILFPEDELKALEERDALELDEGRLENNEYKYVQVIRGRIQRAFTEDELRVGMRNPVSDIYANGYSISELELLVSLVTSHLQTEFYNRSYFQQGFSAKGILHIKANLNRSKLEDLRRNWNHMVKGNRNSFQTPIMAGMDEVQWIPLTQSHSEMEFSMWLNYLIRMICSIFQIDPSEIGYGIKDAGGSSGMSGDNTKEKLANSKDKGLIPLMKFLQDYINKNIIETLDSDYKMEWVGLEEESENERIERQEKEVKFKKTVNEIRAEDGLPPIKGADHLILDPQYMAWYTTMSDEGKKLTQEQNAAMTAGQPQEPGHQQQWEADEASKENDHMRNIEGKVMDNTFQKEQAKAAPKPGMKKSMRPLRVEYYRLRK